MTRQTLRFLSEIRKDLGFDRPYHVQLGNWAWNMLRGDLGTSIFSKREITELILPRLQPTLSLGITGDGHLHSSRRVDRDDLGMALRQQDLTGTLMFFAVLGFATPGFWLAFIMIWAFAVNLGWFPVLGYSPMGDGILKHLHSMFLPVAVNSVLGFAFISRITRSAMLDVMREDYIRTARAKGLSDFTVFLRHAMRPSAIPVVTVIGAAVAGLATGFVITESIFAIPGLGRMLVDAIVRRDYPIIQALLMVVATVLILVNLLIDVIYAYIDPRIRY